MRRRVPPLYVDGEMPRRAGARRRARRPPDSPWWRFKQLLTLVERDWPRRGPQVRAYWDEIEQVLDGEAAEVEAKAVRLRRAGQHDAASRLLTRFMEANVALALRLERLIGSWPTTGNSPRRPAEGRAITVRVQ